MAKILEELKDLMEQEDIQEDIQEEVTEEEESESVDEETPEEEEEKDDEPVAEKNEAEEKETAQSDDEDIRVKKNEYYAMRRKAQKADAQVKDETDPDVYEKQLMQEALQEIRIKKAMQEYQSMEVDFLRSSGVKDYEEVTTGYRNSVYNSLRVLDPRASHASLVDMTRKQMLVKASEYLNKGLDPIAEMYFEAKELGFKPAKKEEAPPAKEDNKPKTDLKKIAQNKKRSSGMAAAPSSGSTSPSGNLTPKEFKDLSPEQKRAYLADI